MVGSLNSAVKGNDLVEVVLRTQVKIMYISSEAGPEGNREFTLEVSNLETSSIAFTLENVLVCEVGETWAYHAICVDTRNRESKPVH